jgi:L-lactate dehydrogenase (cytochrome)
VAALENLETPNSNALATLLCLPVLGLRCKRNMMWLRILGKTYDVTAFNHPGGDLSRYAAMPDCTAEFLARHPESFLRLLQQQPGFTAGFTAGDLASSNQAPGSQASLAPPPEEWVSPQDAELAASLLLPRTTLAYFQTGSCDEFTLRENRRAFSRVLLKPRVLVDVSRVRTVAQAFGRDASFPVFLSATAVVGLAHPSGERVPAQACAECNVPYMVPHLSSEPLESIVRAMAGPHRWLQMYLPKDPLELARLLDRAAALGFEALFITVDAVAVGKRERDVRARMRELPRLANAEPARTTTGSAPRSAAGGSKWDESFSWTGLARVLARTPLAVVLKGVQRGDDAVRAVQMGCRAVLVSNHGGRNLDGARPSLACLVEVDGALRRAGLRRPGQSQVLFDGGVQRGTDVLKALACGADLVGVGRAGLFAAVQGVPGVKRLLGLLQEEVSDGLKLLGAADVLDVTSEGDWVHIKSDL